jgi:pilus assembly protein CpaE
MDGVAEKVKVVVNRAGLDSGQISLKKAQDTIGREIFWQLPNDYRTMVEVRNNGVPLIEQAPKAAITQAVVLLAEALCSHESSEEVDDSQKTSSSRGFFGLWGGKSRGPAGK